MLKTFSKDNPASLTLNAFYNSEVAASESQAMIQRKRLPMNTALIADIRKASSINYLDAIWKEWKDEDEVFDDFQSRIQTWPSSNEDNLSLICLVDPSNPQYSFPQFVRTFNFCFSNHTDQVFSVSQSLYLP
jgi:hypothetical protein